MFSFKNFFKTKDVADSASSTAQKYLILIVEDEDLLSRMYSQKLQIDGFDCLVANNGEEGLELATTKNPDLIICDVMMPIKDGLSMLRDVKSNPATVNIPIIMLSNLSDKEDVDKALSMGAVDYLVKVDLDPADVVKKIKEVLVGSKTTK